MGLNVHLSVKDPFGDDLNDLPTESFEIGLRRDARMVLAGPGPGTRGQDFVSVGEFGVDCTPTALCYLSVDHAFELSDTCLLVVLTLTGLYELRVASPNMLYAHTSHSDGWVTVGGWPITARVTLVEMPDC